ncbi:MAG: exodeoxyribonuclease VII small subunit [Deltaproteobacteria bacterium]|nr:exodeoxyribonuclease VII small subunit [Deltaproteobacteria bacterium]
MAEKTAEVRLEDALKRLAEIVKTLEQGDGALEDSLKLFEEGVALTRACHSKLSDAEKRIEILSRVTPQGVETKPLNQP